jgi:lysophospholipase L1-like esterase
MTRTLPLLAALAALSLAAAPARAEDPATNAAPRVVACVGDSITWGGGGGGSYPSKLQAELGEGWKVLNYGVNSRTARREGKEFDLRPGDLDYRKTLNYTKSLACKPFAVILMIGTNDSKPPNWEETGDAFRAGYSDLVDDYLALDPKPFVVIGVSPTVKGGGFTYGVTEKIVGGGVVPFQRKVAEEKKLPLVDCREVLDPHMATAYSRDGLHPNDEGNALLAAAFAAKLRDLARGDEETTPHAEGAEDQSHAESAENAETNSHAESAEKQP